MKRLANIRMRSVLALAMVVAGAASAGDAFSWKGGAGSWGDVSSWLDAQGAVDADGLVTATATTSPGLIFIVR